MGKRSGFERLPRDLYPTPAAAMLPLIPHLRGVRTFAEPCAGDGDLVRHLESNGPRCVYPPLGGPTNLGAASATPTAASSGP
jgi:hypothetical protein